MRGIVPNITVRIVATATITNEPKQQHKDNYVFQVVSDVDRGQ